MTLMCWYFPQVENFIDSACMWKTYELRQYNTSPQVKTTQMFHASSEEQLQYVTY